MPNTTGKHTPGAVKIANIIMNGKNRIKTDWGEKSAQGIADLIDNETHAPELLEALKELVSRTKMLDQTATHEGITNCEVIAKARGVIAKAEGRS